LIIIVSTQALLANMAAMYAVYHGPEGLKTIAQRVHGLAGVFALGLKKLSTEVQDLPFFDTVKIKTANAQAIADVARKSEINLRVVDGNIVSVTFYCECYCFHVLGLLSLVLFRSLLPLMKQQPWRMLITFSKFFLMASM